MTRREPIRCGEPSEAPFDECLELPRMVTGSISPPEYFQQRMIGLSAKPRHRCVQVVQRGLEQEDARFNTTARIQ